MKITVRHDWIPCRVGAGGGGQQWAGLVRESRPAERGWRGASARCFWGQKERHPPAGDCCAADCALSPTRLLAPAADTDPRGSKSETASLLLFPAEQPPPSLAWRPAALTLLTLCLVLLLGLAALGLVCKSALWLGGGTWFPGLSRMRTTTCYRFFFLL